MLVTATAPDGLGAGLTKCCASGNFLDHTTRVNSIKVLSPTLNKLNILATPSIGPSRQGSILPLRSIELAVTAHRSALARDASIIGRASFELPLKLCSYASKFCSRPPRSRHVCQCPLPASADPSGSCYLESDAGKHRVAVGDDAASGAGRPLDGSEGQDEERLA